MAAGLGLRARFYGRQSTSDREPFGTRPTLGPAGRHTVPAGDPVHAHVQDLGGVGTLGRIQILPVYGDRAPRIRRDVVGDPSCVRARGAVRSDPSNPVENTLEAAIYITLDSLSPRTIHFRSARHRPQPSGPPLRSQNFSSGARAIIPHSTASSKYRASPRLHSASSW